MIKRFVNLQLLTFFTSQVVDWCESESEIGTTGYGTGRENL